MDPTPGSEVARADLGTCVSAGIDTFKKNPGLHIAAFLIVTVIGSVALGLLWGPMLVGYYRMLAKEASGQKAEIGDVFSGFEDFVPALLAAVIGGVAVAVGFVLCIVPGLLLLPLTTNALYLVAMGEQDGFKAVKRSFESIKANMLMGMLTILVLGLLGNLGVIACVVGLLVTLPIAAIGTFTLAKQMTPGF